MQGEEVMMIEAIVVLAISVMRAMLVIDRLTR